MYLIYVTFQLDTINPFLKTKTIPTMWRAQAAQNVNIQSTNGDDDDWETDPDFVVRPEKISFSKLSVFVHILYIRLLQ